MSIDERWLRPARLITQVKCNERRCAGCGGPTRSPMYCEGCYARSPEGRKERTIKHQRQRYVVLEDGGPCATCQHWYGKCDLGLPEGGTKYAVECPAKFEI